MEETRNYKVYAHIRKEPDENGVYKRYIGITGLKPKYRWNNGKGYKCKNKNGEYVYFYKAILKYGWDGFTHILLLQNLTRKEASDWEVKLIKIYESNNKYYGYNNTSGGEHSTHSDETKRKISYNNANKHITICLETRKIYSSITEIASELNVNKSSISNVCRGDKKSVKGLTFRYYEDYLKLTEKDIECIISKKYIIKSNITPFKCIETGETFYRFKDAGLKYNLDPQIISKYCNNKLSKDTKQTKGLHFKFIDIDNGII